MKRNSPRPTRSHRLLSHLGASMLALALIVGAAPSAFAAQVPFPDPPGPPADAIQTSADGSTGWTNFDPSTGDVQGLVNWVYTDGTPASTVLPGDTIQSSNYVNTKCASVVIQPTAWVSTSNSTLPSSPPMIVQVSTDGGSTWTSLPAVIPPVIPPGSYTMVFNDAGAGPVTFNLPGPNISNQVMFQIELPYDGTGTVDLATLGFAYYASCMIDEPTLAPTTPIYQGTTETMGGSDFWPVATVTINYTDPSGNQGSLQVTANADGTLPSFTIPNSSTWAPGTYPVTATDGTTTLTASTTFTILAPLPPTPTPTDPPPTSPPGPTDPPPPAPEPSPTPTPTPDPVTTPQQTAHPATGLVVAGLVLSFPLVASGSYLLRKARRLGSRR